MVYISVPRVQMMTSFLEGGEQIEVPPSHVFEQSTEMPPSPNSANLRWVSLIVLRVHKQRVLDKIEQKCDMLYALQRRTHLISRIENITTISYSWRTNSGRQKCIVQSRLSLNVASGCRIGL